MDITPKLVEYFVKGHQLSYTSAVRNEEEVAGNIEQVFQSRNNTLTDNVVTSMANSEAAAYPAAASITDEIRKTHGGNGVPGIQALGTIGVLVLIFLVGLANGVRDKKKQKPKK